MIMSGMCDVASVPYSIVRVGAAAIKVAEWGVGVPTDAHTTYTLFTLCITVALDDRCHIHARQPADCGL